LPRVSVIVPLKAPNAYLWETLDCLEQVDYANVEIVVLPDQLSEDCAWAGKRQVTFVPTGPVGPGKKRDIGAALSSGEVLAFLDDDTFPARDWLRHALRHFADPAVGAVGGPAVTPPSDGLLQQASGLVYQSRLGGGNYAYRYTPLEQRDVDDYPTCNLMVRRSAFEAAGGFDTRFWPGEDTKLCLALVHDLELRIVYEPKAVVYHHRRPLFRGHLKQVRSYAMHRGYFVKRFPKTSLRPSYFAPTALVVGMLGGAGWAVLWNPFRKWLGLGMVAYVGGVVASAVAAVVSAAKVTNILDALVLTLLVTAGTVATHVVYGIWFIVGLLAMKLREE
jgi:cellulose synthase/poly-beta-1,6-N-acetylglucosamine synthase-like glycosyltransferase